MSSPTESRTYRRNECAVFRKTAEAFGGLSNMAPGYPVRVNGVRILTVEALYQACRFPHLLDVQRKIIGQHSPMTAKMVSKPYRKDSRPDWDQVRVKVMRWCLRMKLTQHWPKFSQLLLSTGERSIVEDSRKDDFWGALPNEDGTLVGMNVLGRLLMELREAIKQGTELRRVEPPTIADFLLFGEPLQVVDFRSDKNAPFVVEEITAKDTSDELTLPLFAESGAAAPPRAAVMSTALPAERSYGMIEGLKPYAEYKESDIPWAPVLPSSWQTERAKRLFTKMQRPVRPEDDVVTCFRDGMVTLRKNRRLRGFTEATVFSGYQGIRKGDLVIHGMDAFAGAIGVSDSDGKGTPVYNVCKPGPGVVASYYAHTVREMSRAQWILALAKGIRERSTDFRYEIFGDQFVPLPPPDEQAAIVRFLDHANRKIDGFIRAKRKLIGLLNEQKQAIIHHAVTRGLDPDVPLKPSGIPWLGDIPAHWEVWRISRFAKVGNGSTPSRSNMGFWSGGNYPWLNSSHVNRGFIDSADQFVTASALRECHLPKVAAGSVLIAITGQGKTRGTSAVLGFEATINQHIAYITPRITVVTAKYLHLSLVAAYSTLRSISDDSGSTKGALTCEDLKRFKLAVPPIAEQERLVEAIANETHVTTTAIARTEREIALMQEYRTRLTADIVTGKLDVREAAAHLPAPPTEEAAAPADPLEEIETEEIEA